MTHTTQTPKKVWLTLCLITILGLGLRLVNLGEKSLWSDEICTIATAMGNSVDPAAVDSSPQGPFDPPEPRTASFYKAKALQPHGFLALDKTVEVLKQNVHPPFYFWLMNASIYGLGTDPAALRLLSVLFGVACIPMMFLLGRRLGGNGLGLATAAILALSGYQIAHAQDARQYTLVTLLALTSAWWTLRLTDGPRPRWWDWAALGLLSVIGIYSQYFYGLFFVFLLVYATIRRRWDRGFMLKLGLVALGVGLALVPWLEVLQAQMAFMKLAGHYTLGLWNPVELPEILWRILNEFVMPQEKLGKFLVSGALLLGLLAYWRGNREAGNRPVILMAALWVGVILGGQLLLDIVKQSHTITIRRYTLLAAPGFYLLAGAALLQLKAQWGVFQRPAFQKVFVALFLGFMAFNALQVVNGKKLRSDNFRQAALWMNPQIQSRDVVLVNKSGANTVGMAFYLNEDTRISGLSVNRVGDKAERKRLEEKLTRATAASDRVWLVFSHSAGSVEHALDQWLTAHGFRLDEAKKFPGVKVAVFEKAGSKQK